AFKDFSHPDRNPRIFPDDHTYLTTRVGGYTEPEYATHGQLIDKVDVYNYGMLVLEIVSGRKVRDPKLLLEMELLLQWVWSLHKKNEAFELVDRRIAKGESEIDKEEIVGQVNDQNGGFLNRNVSRHSFSMTSMIVSYAQDGHLDIALELFHQTPLAWTKPNLITWNAIISGYAQNGHHDKALELFHLMQQEGIPPDTTSWSVLIA
ncbi:hypothetical protein KI387_012118, partial [Taxus chinensis]